MKHEIKQMNGFRRFPKLKNSLYRTFMRKMLNIESPIKIEVKFHSQLSVKSNDPILLRCKNFMQAEPRSLQIFSTLVQIYANFSTVQKSEMKNKGSLFEQGYFFLPFEIENSPKTGERKTHSTIQFLGLRDLFCIRLILCCFFAWKFHIIVYIHIRGLALKGPNVK